MNTQEPISKLLVSHFAVGFVVGYGVGISNTHSITISFLYSIICVISLLLAEASICYLRKKILKSLTFGIVLGVSVSLLSYFLLSPDKIFLYFTIPIICFCLVGGSLYRYGQTLRLEN